MENRRFLQTVDRNEIGDAVVENDIDSPQKIETRITMCFNSISGYLSKESENIDSQ